MLGSTCRHVICHGPSPQARAAIAYSRDHTPAAAARVMRTKDGML